MDFSGKTVVVTGASRGIGKAIALRFGSMAANVVITYNSNSQMAEEVVSQIAALGGKAIAIKADVTQKTEVEALTERAYAEFGKVDVLVNNAGITKDNLLIRMKEADWDAVMDTNLKGTYLCTQEIGKRMLKAKSGRIVNITSVVGLMGNAGQANYAASKAGVIGFTKSVAKEFAARGLTVNAVAPGFIETDMTDQLNDDVIEQYKKSIPLQRLGSADDVANTVLFLSSDLASYITGQVIQVDGGIYI